MKPKRVNGLLWTVEMQSSKEVACSRVDDGGKVSKGRKKVQRRDRGEGIKASFWGMCVYGELPRGLFWCDANIIIMVAVVPDY